MTTTSQSTSATTHLDVARLEQNADTLEAAFRDAAPFPHIAINGLLNWSPEDVASFPTIEWDRWNALGDRYQHNKRACDDIAAIPEPLSGLIRELSEPRFLQVLEKITGIDRLIPDPNLKGGGLHLSGPGGILSPHTDFHYYRELDLYRRINVLVYLNDDWTLDDGGCLSLFDGNGNAVQTVVPGFGTMVAFRTDDQSIHGFPVPVADGRWRRSVALYYYTSREAGVYSGDETTHWREHGVKSGLTWRARFAGYRALMNLSRGFSILAHVVNPNQGLGLVRTILANRRKAKYQGR